MSRAWMPLYVADYLADTGHLSAAEHGAYMLLIMHYWQHGGLPTEHVRLARIARMNKDEWDASADAIALLFQPGWKHKRIETELQKAGDLSEKRREAAQKRHSGAKKPERDAIAPAIAPDLHEQLHTQSQSQSHKKVESSSELSRPPDDRAEIDEAFALWNETASRCGLSVAQIASDDRRKALRTRLKECGGLDGWRHALGKVEASGFCRGGSSTGWRIDLDAMLQRKTFRKLIEGAYDDRPGAGGGRNRGNPAGDETRPRGVDAVRAGVAAYLVDRGFGQRTRDAGLEPDADDRREIDAHTSAAPSYRTSLLAN